MDVARTSAVLMPVFQATVHFWDKLDALGKEEPCLCVSEGRKGYLQREHCGDRCVYVIHI